MTFWFNFTQLKILFFLADPCGQVFRLVGDFVFNYISFTGVTCFRGLFRHGPSYL